MQEPFDLSLAGLRRLAPHGRPSILAGIAQNSAVLAEFGISANRLRFCHFLAQAAHETAGFTTLREKGGSAYFIRRYGHRRDLGNLRPSDGPRFAGRGIFQLTGRANYRTYGRLLGIDLESHPERALEPGLSLRIACLYWRKQGLNGLADRNELRAITRRINGGYNGLSDRRRYLHRALEVWAADQFTSDRSQGDEAGKWLQSGDQGQKVRCLQKRLKALGYRLAVDGLFGPRTKRALQRFQQAHGFKADGIYGPGVHARMERVLLQFDCHTTQGDQEMDQWKNIWRSRTIWANLIGLVALALDVLGFAGLAEEDKAQLVDQLLKLVEAAGFIAGVAFRALARKRLQSRFL